MFLNKKSVCFFVFYYPRRYLASIEARYFAVISCIYRNIIMKNNYHASIYYINDFQ